MSILAVRPTCVLLALALALPLAAQNLPPVTPRSVPIPPEIAGMTLSEAKHAVDTFATRMTTEIDWLVQPGQRDQAEDKLEAKLGTPAGATGLAEAELKKYDSGRVSGLAVGAFGEVSAQVRDLAGLVTCELSAECLAFFDIAEIES